MLEEGKLYQYGGRWEAHVSIGREKRGRPEIVVNNPPPKMTKH